AVADANNSGWQIDGQIPPNYATWQGGVNLHNTSGSMDFHCTAGTCGSVKWNTNNNFQVYTLKSPTIPGGQTLNYATGTTGVYSVPAVNSGDWLITPGMLNPADQNPVFAMSPVCPVAKHTVNWIF